MQLNNVIFKHAEIGYCKADITIKNGNIERVTVVDNAIQNLKGVEFFVSPGFVNSHLHPNQLFDRQLLDEMSISELLHQMHSLYKKNDEDRYVQALFVLMDAIKSGATSVYAVASHVYPTIKAFKEIGVKGAITCFFNDQWEGHGDAPSISLYHSIEERFLSIHKEKTDKLDIHIGTASVQSASNDLLTLLNDLAVRCGSKVNIHVSEGIESVRSCIKSRQISPIRLLSKLGILSKNWNLIHAVNIDNEEVELISQAQAKVIHCPVSNAKTGVGIAPLLKMLELGIVVGLGTDACSNNNTNNILNEAYFTALIHSALNNNPKLITTEVLLQFLTSNGYQILGRKEKGTIEVGEPADLLLWSLSNTAFVPVNYGKFDSSIFYNAPDIKPHTVLIDGRVVVENYQFVVLPERDIIEAANAHAAKLSNAELMVK